MEEIFKLVGRVIIDNEKAKQDLQEFNEEAESHGSKLDSIIGKIGATLENIATKVVKFGALAVGAVTTAVGAFTKMAVGYYAEYEQLIGGVETLFGAGGKTLEEYAKFTGQTVDKAKKKYNDLIKAQKDVIKNAENAFKNSGLSMNAYMQTVTTFSGSLLQALDGDTVEAARVSEMAINDMSDNANKMGTSMQSIMYAYQGFSKQNYMMLDNLKLGYGGTKAEMERLLADANKINAEQGKMTNYSIENLNDVFDAIHTVQVKMGIYGTTAKEASTTIQGSMSMMKAAWENFLTGMADPTQDFDKLLNNLVDSVVTFAENIVPRIIKTLPRMMQGLGTLISMLAQQLPPLLDELIPVVLEAVGNIIKAVVETLPSMLESLWETMNELYNKLGTDVKGAIEDVALALGTLTGVYAAFKAGSTINELVKSWQTAKLNLHLYTMAMGESTIAQGVLNGTLTFGETIVALLTGKVTLAQLATGLWAKTTAALNAAWLANPIGIVIAAIGALIGIIVVAYNKSETFRNFVNGLWENIKTIFASAVETIKNAFEVIKNIVQVALMFIGNLFKLWIDIILIPYRFIWENCKDIIMNVWNTIKSFISGVLNSISSTFSNVWNAIKGTVSNVVSSIKNTVVNTFNSVKSSVTSIFNSIKSTATSIWNSIKSAIEKPIKAAKETVSNMIDKIKEKFNFKWSLPKLKLPHVKIDGEFSLFPPKVPSFGIDWYAKAMKNPMIMDKPTAFGINPRTGNVQVGGEAGNEMIGGVNTIMNMIREAVGDNNGSLAELLERIIDILNFYLPTLQHLQVVLDTGTLVGETAPMYDEEFGKITKWKGTRK